MREQENAIDIDQLHKLFMAGEKIVVIAHKMNKSEGYIQKQISKERKRYPDKWPKRQAKTPSMKLDIYQCEECNKAFGVEHNDEPKVCPCCNSELWEYSHSGELKTSRGRNG